MNIIVYLKWIFWLLLLLLILYYIYKKRKEIKEKIKFIFKFRFRDEEFKKLLIIKKPVKTLPAPQPQIAKPEAQLPYSELQGKLNEWEEKKYYGTIKLNKRLKERIKRYKKKRQEKKIIKHEARAIKRSIKKREIKPESIGEMKKRLERWKKEGYYNTGKIQKELDEYEKKNKK